MRAEVSVWTTTWAFRGEDPTHGSAWISTPQKHWQDKTYLVGLVPGGVVLLFDHLTSVFESLAALCDVTGCKVWEMETERSARTADVELDERDGLDGCERRWETISFVDAE